MKKDFTPTELKIGNVTFYIARHFGFCYGVENAIEIAFNTLENNPGKQIYLLSEMIHNPKVNDDLKKQGIAFIMDTKGQHYISWDEVRKEDIVIIPAFGTTLETLEILRAKGIEPMEYNTTCPFVEKVWNRSEQIGNRGYTIIIHGKPRHEETRATFSHSSRSSPSLVINNLNEAKRLAKYIRKEKEPSDFFLDFDGRYSDGFDPLIHLDKIGVVNQTTMLAEDTQEIADYLKEVIIDHYGIQDDPLKDRFADTRDTLCYATNDNQTAVKGMLEKEADLALVVGGYNSSNTSHLVELCEEKLPTFFVKDAEEIQGLNSVWHFNFHLKERQHRTAFIPDKEDLKVLITAGASCPDAVVEEVIIKIASLKDQNVKTEELIPAFTLP